MIAAVLADRCTGCGDCVAACPSNVLEATADGHAVIVRQGDCQTCFLCELHCPVDALYVDPDCEAVVTPDLPALLAAGVIGKFRRDSGWGDDVGGVTDQHWRMDGIFARARALAEATAR